MSDSTTDVRDLPSPRARAARRFPLTRREVGLVAGFWALFAVFRVADQVFTAPDLPTAVRWLVPPAAESLCWIVCTPVVFAAVEWALRRPRRLSAQLALYVAVGAATALVTTGVGVPLRTRYHLRRAPVTQPVPQPVEHRPGPLPGPRLPFWFRFGDAAALYLAVLATALARVTAVRARTDREQAAVLEARLAEARLEALRRQLDPHFLFNTHALIAALIEPDPPGARRMLAQLSEFLRVSLREGGAQEVPLAQELALVDLYLDIVRVRYEGRLEVEMRIDPAARDALVPPLVLQPLVENAVKHGVERRRGRGRLGLDVARTGDAVVLRVRDGGTAPDRGAADGAADTPGGVGLRNTAARLAQLYGSAARLTLAPAPGGGMETTVRLPFHTAPVDTVPVDTVPVHTVPVHTVPVHTTPVHTVDRPGARTGGVTARAPGVSDDRDERVARAG